MAAGKDRPQHLLFNSKLEPKELSGTKERDKTYFVDDKQQDPGRFRDQGLVVFYDRGDRLNPRIERRIPMTLEEIDDLVERVEKRKPEDIPPPGQGSGLLIAEFAPKLFALIQSEEVKRECPSTRMLESNATHIPEGQPWRYHL